MRVKSLKARWKQLQVWVYFTETDTSKIMHLLKNLGQLYGSQKVGNKICPKRNNKESDVLKQSPGCNSWANISLFSCIASLLLANEKGGIVGNWHAGFSRAGGRARSWSQAQSTTAFLCPQNEFKAVIQQQAETCTMPPVPSITANPFLWQNNRATPSRCTSHIPQQQVGRNPKDGAHRGAG